MVCMNYVLTSSSALLRCERLAHVRRATVPNKVKCVLILKQRNLLDVLEWPPTDRSPIHILRLVWDHPLCVLDMRFPFSPCVLGTFSHRDRQSPTLRISRDNPELYHEHCD